MVCQNISLVLFSYIVDLLFGDPEWLPHPVRWIGRLISFLDRILRGNRDIWIERMKGVTAVLIVVGVSACSAYLFIFLMERSNPFLGNLVSIYVGYVCLSIKDLRIKGMAIMKELKENDIFKARRELSKIVGRDTDSLSEEKVVAATVESIAENTNDGIVAPLFYLILGGPVLAITHKAINTLDSMVGYKNEKYIHFGWFSARLDDIVNLIPARITGILIVLSIFIITAFKNPPNSLRITHHALRIMLRDGKNHPSPNSGVPEAAMAGALGIRLGGGAFYQGKFVERQYIGKDIKKVDTFFISEALKISFLTSVLMLILGVLFKWLI